jgi:diguanylate cyclase (GGDEF)-like protein
MPGRREGEADGSLAAAAQALALRALGEFALGPTRSKPALFESVLGELAALAGCGLALVAELPARGLGGLRVAARVQSAVAGLPLPARGAEIASEAGVIGEALCSRAPVFSNASESCLFAGGAELAGTLAMPLVAQGELLGALLLADRAGGWDDECAQTLEPIAGALAHLALGFRRAAARARAEEDLLRSLRHLKRGAALDGLTGLAGRASTLGAIEEAARRTGAAGLPLALVVLDLDHAKQLSGRIGAASFDEVLKGVARTLHEALRPTDWTGRWGDDAFAVALLGCDLELAAMVAERVRLRVEGASFAIWGSTGVSVTLSAGVASSELAPEEGAALAARAMRALEEAKRAGRNRVSVSRPARV